MNAKKKRLRRETLEFPDAGAAVILSGAQVRRINTDYLDQMMGGPVDDLEEDRRS